MKKSELKKIIREIITESPQNDINAVIRAIRNYNRTNRNIKDLDYLVLQIIKDLGFKPNKNNIDNVRSHLIAISDGDPEINKIPEKISDVKELYQFLK